MNGVECFSFPNFWVFSFDQKIREIMDFFFLTCKNVN